MEFNTHALPGFKALIVIIMTVTANGFSLTPRSIPLIMPCGSSSQLTKSLLAANRDEAEDILSLRKARREQSKIPENEIDLTEELGQPLSSGIQRDTGLEELFDFEPVRAPLPSKKIALQKARKKRKPGSTKASLLGFDERAPVIEDTEEVPDDTVMKKFFDSKNPFSEKKMQERQAKREKEGPVPFNKVIENITWFGIGLLAVWEIYINSPFFERVEPMIPTVF